MLTPVLNSRWPRAYPLQLLYALFVGLLGLLVLVLLFARQATPVDLYALLLFTVVALVLSYFKIPICSIGTGASQGQTPALPALWDVELGLEGTVILGATLVGGPAFGGWTAFIVGLVTPLLPVLWEHTTWHASDPGSQVTRQVVPQAASRDLASASRRDRTLGSQASAPRPRHHSPLDQAPWANNAAMGLLNGGRNVIAIALAWWAYAGMGGSGAPIRVDASWVLAFAVLCVVYTLVRRFCAWPVLVLQSSDAYGQSALLQALETVFAPPALLVELLPLSIALLVSAAFVALGWSYFLLLALVFIGLSAVMRQMYEVMGAMREQIHLLELSNQVKQAIDQTTRDSPHNVGALCALTYPLCSAIAPAARFEMGLYDRTATYFQLKVAVDGADHLPPMNLPLTPLWSWLGARQEPFLAETEAQLATLPFELPPFGQDRQPRSALFVPLLYQGGRETAGDRGGSDDPFSPADDNSPSGSTSDGEPLAQQDVPPLGALVLQSPYPRAFRARDVKRIAVVAEQISLAIQAAQ